MDPLKEKARGWQEKVIKLIVILAVLGCLVLSLAVYLLTRTLEEMSSAIGGKTTAPATDRAHP